MTPFRKKFADGKITPEELHAQLAFPKGAKCTGCGRPPMTCARVYYPLDEVIKAKGALIGDILMDARLSAEFYKTLVQLKSGPHMHVSTVYACKSCKPDLVRQAARGPSWAFVDFDDGPGPDKFVSGATSANVILA